MIYEIKLMIYDQLIQFILSVYCMLINARTDMQIRSFSCYDIPKYVPTYFSLYTTHATHALYGQKYVDI